MKLVSLGWIVNAEVITHLSEGETSQWTKVHFIGGTSVFVQFPLEETRARLSGASIPRAALAALLEAIPPGVASGNAALMQAVSQAEAALKSCQ